MTRVAVVEPQPRMSGVTAYTWHAAAGFAAAGCDVDIVTFTKSGKPKMSSEVSEAKMGGWGWWHLPVSVTAKWADAAKVLNAYDLVVLNEAKCLPLDKEALKKMEGGDMAAARKRVREGEMAFEELPLYAQAMADVTVPWVGILHAPQYMFTKAPMLSRFLKNVPRGLLVHHKPGALESALWAGAEEHDELFWPYLPYEPKHDPEPRELPRVVGTTGRFITNKGQPTLIAAADFGRPDWTTEVWGAGDQGISPTHTFLAYEGLVTQLGWTGRREGKPGSPYDAIGNAGDALSVFPWWAEKEGMRVSYHGGYTERDDVYARFGVYANLTDPGFCGVGNEYTHLEAMDRGVVPAVQPACLPERGPDSYAGVVVEPFRGPVTLGGKRGENYLQKPGEEEVLELVREKLRDAAALAEGPERAWTQEANFAQVRKLNSPKAYAEAVLERALPGHGTVTETVTGQ